MDSCHYVRTKKNEEKRLHHRKKRGKPAITHALHEKGGELVERGEERPSLARGK